MSKFNSAMAKQRKWKSRLARAKAGETWRLTIGNLSSIPKIADASQQTLKWTQLNKKELISLLVGEANFKPFTFYTPPHGNSIIVKTIYMGKEWKYEHPIDRNGIRSPYGANIDPLRVDALNGWVTHYKRSLENLNIPYSKLTEVRNKIAEKEQARHTLIPARTSSGKKMGL